MINLTKKGKTIIIVTHDPRIAKMVAEHPSGRNIWINDGRLIDTPEDGIADWFIINLTDKAKKPKKAKQTKKV